MRFSQKSVILLKNTLLFRHAFFHAVHLTYTLILSYHAYINKFLVRELNCDLIGCYMNDYLTTKLYYNVTVLRANTNLHNFKFCRPFRR